MKNIILGLFVLFLFGCEKNIESPNNESEEISIASIGDGQSEESFTTVFNDVMSTYASDILSNDGNSQKCYKVEIEKQNGQQPFPIVVTITFPKTGCIGEDGKVRRGQIETTYTQKISVPGGESTTTFIDFSVDSIKIEGTHKIKNLVEPAQIMIYPPQYNFKWEVKVLGGRLTFPNGEYSEWSSTKVIEQVLGSHTQIMSDNLFRILGSSRGSIKKGNKNILWESQIIEPLLRKSVCPYIVKGKIKTVRKNSISGELTVAVLDFGNGECDNLASLTVNGETKTVKFK